jgi:hypothetical protein
MELQLEKVVFRLKSHQKLLQINNKGLICTLNNCWMSFLHDIYNYEYFILCLNKEEIPYNVN